jgi:hypothetical protein
MEKKNMWLRDKKGVSEIIGYILLISIAIALSIIVYAWLKSYVPNEKIACPDDVSVMIKDYVMNCQSGVLELNLKNNGKFNIAGYYLRASDLETAEVATKDLSEKIISGGEAWKNIVVPEKTEGIEKKNNFEINEELTQSFSTESEIKFIELIPVRNQDYENKWKTVSCTNSKIKQKILCSEEENAT